VVISPKVIHIAASDSDGGASRAAYRLHRALQKLTGNSEMLVGRKKCDDELVHEIRRPRLLSFINRIKRLLSEKKWADFSAPGQFFHTSANYSNDILSGIRQLPHDIVNIHWIGSETLSIEEIEIIEKPIVLTLHDMWAFCGAEHHSPDVPAARFRVGYVHGNRTKGETGADLNRWVWERKRKAWKKGMAIVCPSRWLADCANGSLLFRGWQIHCIPNPLDVERWRPLPNKYSRQLLGLPAEERILLFAANGGELNPFKGADMLFEALTLLQQRGACNVHLVVLGRSTPKMPVGYPCPVTYLGKLQDDTSLVAAYNAADVVIVPSSQENLPQAAIEAHACGIPVVAFNIGGLPDIIEHQKTGYLARPFDITDLADGIAWVLGDEQLRQMLGSAARKSAVCKYAEPVIAKVYGELYEQLQNS